ncbi:MAG TPA: hypothetical protein VN714_29495 [Trebonia sp.]|nr:hypothetical protein [Trebonia sp.]
MHGVLGRRVGQAKWHINGTTWGESPAGITGSGLAARVIDLRHHQEY